MHHAQAISVTALRSDSPVSSAQDSDELADFFTGFHGLVDDFWQISDEEYAEIKAYNLKPQRAPLMRAAEGEWLDPEILQDATEPTDKIAKKYRRPQEQQRHAKLFKGPRTQKLPARIKPPETPEITPGDTFYQEIKTYDKRFLPLLETEQAEGNTVLKERLLRPIEKLREDGYCVDNLSAYWLDATQFGRPVAVFSRGAGESSGVHQFDNGSQVLLSRSHPQEKQYPIIGSVISKTVTKLSIVFDSKFEVHEGYWRLDLSSTDIGYRRMKTAINSMKFDPAVLAAGSTETCQNILVGTYLRDLLLGGFSANPESIIEGDENSHDGGFKHLVKYDPPPQLSSPQAQLGPLSSNMVLHSWAQRYQKPTPIKLDGDPILDLNESQTQAVACMLGNRLSLVQGPPGTGKSKTLVESVRILKQHFGVSLPIMVCTYTNVAVDNLVESLVKVGLKPTRVGFSGRVPTPLHEYTLDARIEAHPRNLEVIALRQQLMNIERRLSSLQARMRGMATTDEQRVQLDKLDFWNSKLGSVRSRKWAIERGILTEIVSKSDVICTTAITSACAALQVVDFPIVFLDEASMSTEPAALVPVMRGSQHVALVGDHKQLPPVVVSKEAAAGGLSLSLFERLALEGDTPMIMLTKQYRMHPAISHFPSKEFYDHLLIDGTVNAAGDASPAWVPPLSSLLLPNPGTDKAPSAVFVDHAGLEIRKDRSVMNPTEADIVCRILVDLLLKNPSMSGADIGIIAPYAAQIRHIRRVLSGSDPASSTQFVQALGRHRTLQLPLVEVKTVDGFEGREKDVIIFSTVRSNSAGKIGFLADRRRLNVGLTRAKRGLFVVGNQKTLLRGKLPFLRTVDKEKHISRPDDNVWTRYIEYMVKAQLVKQMSPDHLSLHALR